MNDLYFLTKLYFLKECSPGKYRNNCSEECTDGFYGLKCRKNCPSECNNTCDKVSGVCPGQGQGNNTPFNI